MLIKAAKDYNIDLKESWMIGDGLNDIEAGKAAGCRTALLKGSVKDYDYESLFGAVGNICKQKV